LVISEALEQCGGETPKKIFFNDLSAAMTQAALEGSLTVYAEKNISLEVIPGPIHAIAGCLPAMPRRVIVGVYSAKALVHASPEEDYLRVGLEEYLSNAAILGDRFVFEPFGLQDGQYRALAPKTFLSAWATSEQLGMVIGSLATLLGENIADAVRVIGQHHAQPGYFLSHWFTEKGILELLRGSFDPRRMGAVRIKACPKGFVLCIDPLEPPRGIVTLLNNVVGNVLPADQTETLRVVDRLST
jgi:hypothetical protein